MMITVSGRRRIQTQSRPDSKVHVWNTSKCWDPARARHKEVDQSGQGGLLGGWDAGRDLYRGGQWSMRTMWGMGERGSSSSPVTLTIWTWSSLSGVFKGPGFHRPGWDSGLVSERWVWPFLAPCLRTAPARCPAPLGLGAQRLAGSPAGIMVKNINVV